MSLEKKIQELNIDSLKKKELLTLLSKYEKKAGFFANFFSWVFVIAIVYAGFLFGKGYKNDIFLKPLTNEVVIKSEKWWGLRSHEQVFLIYNGALVPKK